MANSSCTSTLEGRATWADLHRQLAPLHPLMPAALRSARGRGADPATLSSVQLAGDAKAPGCYPQLQFGRFGEDNFVAADAHDGRLRGGGALKKLVAKRDRLMARAEAAKSEARTAALRERAWSAHQDVLLAECTSRKAAILKLRALLQPEIGASMLGDFTSADAANVEEVVIWLEEL